MFETAERELGPIKALVNNAGITGGFARVEEVTADAIHKTFTVNVTGAILCAREAVRRMSTRHGGSGGAIVNISPARSHGAAGEWVHYALRRERSIVSRSDLRAKWPPKASASTPSLLASPIPTSTRPMANPDASRD